MKPSVVVSGPALDGVLARAWEAAAAVTDPEVPVLTIADLGVLRSVEWDSAGGDRVVVTITPTYSGCPAMHHIEQRVVESLAAAGIEASVQTVFSPAWTTDWMSDEGRRKLVAYGIAAPHRAAPATDGGSVSVLFVRPPVRCPHCGSRHTSLVSEFGSTACKALYRCRDCREPFDYFKEL